MSEHNTPFKHKENRGSLFPNEKKDTEMHPDFKGSINVAGEEYWVSMWTADPDKKTAFSLSVTKKDGAPGKSKGYKVPEQKEDTESIPF